MCWKDSLASKEFASYPGDLSLVPETNIKVEEENQLEKVIL